MPLDYVSIGPKDGEPAQFVIIWLHGLGADGHDFVPIVGELGIPSSSRVKFLFPHAPHRPITVNGGYAMRAWYDVRHSDLRQFEDVEGMMHSRAKIDQLIDAQVAAGVDRRNILLAGFSQGGVMALYCGLQQADQSVAGIVALSCYLPTPGHMADAIAKLKATPKVFLAHGSEDRIIPLGAGIDARNELLAVGVTVEWHEYPIAHSVSEQEVRHIALFIRRALLGLAT